MKSFSEKKDNRSRVQKVIMRIAAYLFCSFLVWYGFNILTEVPITLKDKLRGIGIIVAACVYLFVDIKILISQNKSPNR
jgi:hypothetical protein